MFSLHGILILAGKSTTVSDDGDDMIMIGLVRCADKLNKFLLTHFLRQQAQAALLSLVSESGRKPDDRHRHRPEQQEGR